MNPGVAVEVREAAGDVVPVGLAVVAPGVSEHVDVVQRVGASCRIERKVELKKTFYQSEENSPSQYLTTAVTWAGFLWLG